MICGEEVRLLDAAESKQGSKRGETDSTSERRSLLMTSGEDDVILISGEGAVYLHSMGEQLLITSGDGDKL